MDIEFGLPIAIKRHGKNYWFALMFNARDKVWIAYYRHEETGVRHDSGIGNTIELAVEDIRKRADITEQDYKRGSC